MLMQETLVGTQPFTSVLPLVRRTTCSKSVSYTIFFGRNCTGNVMRQAWEATSDGEAHVFFTALRLAEIGNRQPETKTV